MKTPRKKWEKDISEKSTQKFALNFPQMNEEICNKMLRYHIVQEEKVISPLIDEGVRK